jgi:hypothetical protein
MFCSPAQGPTQGVPAHISTRRPRRSRRGSTAFPAGKTCSETLMEASATSPCVRLRGCRPSPMTIAYTAPGEKRCGSLATRFQSISRSRWRCVCVHTLVGASLRAAQIRRRLRPAPRTDVA